MDLRFQAGFGAAQGVADLLMVAGAQGAYLVAVERLGGGLRSYDVEDLSLRAYRPHQGANLATGQAVELAGSGRVLLAGSAGVLGSHQVDASGGALAEKASWSLPGLSATDQISAVTSTTVAAGQAVVYGLAGSDIRGWQVNDSGASNAVARAGNAEAYAHAEVTHLAVASVGGQQLLVAADAGLGGLRSFTIADNNGALAAADQLGAGDGLGIAAPTALETVSAYGQSFAILGAAGTSSLSVVQLSASGGLILMDHSIDSLGSRFGQVTALKSFVVEDHVFVLAGGGDGGLELLRLLPGGQLISAAQLIHETGQGLQNITAIETYISGDEVSIFVASEGGLNADGEGIAEYVLSRATLGVVLTASGATLSGTAGDDLLLGNGRATQIRGGAGDDMLVAGAMGDQLEGGAGADRFVLGGRDGVANGTGRVDIVDFEAGRDVLDLSLLPGLRSLSQLEVETRSTGITLGWQGLELRITSADGGRLELTDLWPLGWAQAHHLPVGETLPASTLTGSSGNDSLLGDDRDETVAGGDGNDTIYGQAGADELEGGAGGDVLLGGFGRDTLSGGAGNDQLFGGADPDHLDGGDGADALHGDAGGDHLLGGAGDDTLWGGSGDDRLEAGAGVNQLLGEAGADSLLGGAEQDRLEGGAGADSLSGGAGDDHLDGGDDVDHLWGDAGGDSLYGGEADDFLWGGHNTDQLWGEAGRDQLRGGTGDDTLYGGTGADSLLGQAGHDLIWGGTGQDQLSGGTGRDSLNGGAGADSLFGNAGADAVSGGKGADWISGKGGADRLWGNQGADRLLGYQNNDDIWGGNGADYLNGHNGQDDLWGGAGNDSLLGGAQRDHLRGGLGKDKLYGQNGHDLLEGQQGDDLLRGGAGNDTLKGGLGADVFVFEKQGGHDRVLDFNQGQDLLHLRFLGSQGAQSFAEVGIRQTGEDLVLDIGIGQVTLVDRAGLDLQADDFQF